jgi:membrane-bound serine protease (ClpP class)
MDSTYLTLGLFLIGLGLFLLLAELFIPTGGILFVLSLGSVIVGVVLVFKYDQAAGLVALFGVSVAVPVLGGLVLYLGPRMFQPANPVDTGAGLTFDPELEQLKGRFGRTISALRPAGMVDFDGRRIDTLTEGMMVEPGQWVRCVDVKGGKVIVRPVEKPNLGDLETAVFG